MAARSKNQGSMSVAVLLVFGLLLSGVYGVDKTTTSTDDTGETTAPPDTCSDGIDNDNDGSTDADDNECDPTHPAYDGDEDTPDGAPPPP